MNISSFCACSRVSLFVDMHLRVARIYLDVTLSDVFPNALKLFSLHRRSHNTAH